MLLRVSNTIAASAAVTASGRVAEAGNIAVTLASGMKRAVGRARLSGTSGSGTCRAALAPAPGPRSGSNALHGPGRGACGCSAGAGMQDIENNPMQSRKLGPGPQPHRGVAAGGDGQNGPTSRPNLA